jgi:hypothetical protein
MSNIPVTGPGNRGSITLDSGSSTVRQSPRTDFGTQVRNGIAAGGGAAGQAIGVAAPFVPGAAVVSAAVTGAAGGVGGGIGGGGAQTGYGGQGLGGVPGATSVGSDGIPVGGSFLNAQQGSGGAQGSGGSSQMELLNATKNMQEMAQSFNLQYLQLQEKMQSENRSFSTVSNVMKTKHDTAKSSISNVR